MVGKPPCSLGPNLPESSPQLDENHVNIQQCLGVSSREQKISRRVSASPDTVFIVGNQQRRCSAECFRSKAGNHDEHDTNPRSGNRKAAATDSNLERAQSTRNGQIGRGWQRYDLADRKRVYAAVRGPSEENSRRR